MSRAGSKSYGRAPPGVASCVASRTRIELALHFLNDGCGQSVAIPVIRYVSAGLPDMSYRLAVPLAPHRRISLVLPVFHLEAPARTGTHSTADFRGIELEPEQLPCLLAVTEARPGGFPDAGVVMTAEAGTQSFGPLPDVQPWPARVVYAARGKSDRSTGVDSSFSLAPIARYVAPDARRGAGRLRIDGAATGAFAYLYSSAAIAVPADRVLVVEGELLAGGLTVGGSGGMGRSINITRPGEFRVLVSSPGGSDVHVVIANCLRGDERRTTAVVDGVAWRHAPKDARP